ncbi:MFS transporter [Litorilinea aerophila]|uniref:MFS transporter n=1 Tax=Litorilinea aerophila TaxID=1204385 RepID=A0A540VKB0_9CHLR|nr:MFS transporter [Litorilinea aerophila]MCC9075265.1 MFS transporter [Litorilinea aerophila]OUC06878.1 hypothetical protein RY27_18290 [Litorilinea aerophila]GIV78407.1 MAG: hypothetical protein KatS3mg050_2801 [Litorilinea sp.]GIV80455.1 MAG: hypothetical protein KatS3mg050_4849 [Litorilinea sp.]
MVAAYWSTLRLFNRNVLLYLGATALLGFAVDGGVYAVIFNLYLLRLGFGPEFIGQVNSAGLFVFAVACLPAGALGGRWGSRPLLLVGMALMGLGAWLSALAELAAPGAPGGWLLVANMVVYLGMALYYTNAAPFIMEATTPAERNHLFSMQTAVLALAGFTGSLLGGFLPRLFALATGIPQEEPAPYRFPLFLTACLLLPALWALWQTRLAPPPGLSQAEGPGPVSPWLPRHRLARMGSSLLGLMLALIWIRFLQVAGVGAATTFFNVYMDQALQVKTAQIGLLTALGRLSAVPAALFTPILMQRWGAPQTVILASGATVLGLLPLAIGGHWAMAGLGFIGVAAASSIRYPAYMAFTMELVPPQWRATLSGAGEMAGGLSFAAMALVGGYVIAHYGYPPLFLLSAGLAFLGTVTFWRYFRDR